MTQNHVIGLAQLRQAALPSLSARWAKMHVDTVGLSTKRRLPDAVFKQLISKATSYIDARSVHGWWLLRLHNLTRQDLVDIHRIVETYSRSTEHSLFVSRLDIATDMSLNDRWAAQCFLRHHLFTRNGATDNVHRLDFYGDRKRPLEDDDGNLLADPETGEISEPEACDHDKMPNGNFASVNFRKDGPRAGMRQPTRTFMCYADPDDYPADDHVLRLEMRFTSSSRIGKYFGPLNTLMERNEPIKILSRHLCLRFVDREKAIKLLKAQAGKRPRTRVEDFPIGLLDRLLHWNPCGAVLRWEDADENVYTCLGTEEFSLPVPVAWVEI